MGAREPRASALRPRPSPQQPRSQEGLGDPRRPRHPQTLKEPWTTQGRGAPRERMGGGVGASGGQ